MKFTIEEYRISSHYLSSLINGDSSGLEDKEAVDFDDWVEIMQDGRMGHWDWDCDSEGYIAMCEVTGLLSDCTTVRFIYRVDLGDNV